MSIKNRISANAFELPCPACILERPLLLREEVRAGVRPQEMEGSWAVCNRGFHALNRKAQEVLPRLRK